LDEEKSKRAGLAHHKSFGGAGLHNLLRLAKGATHSKALHLPEKECSKYYVTAVLPVSSDWWARWFTSNSLAPICSPNFSFMGGGCPKQKKKVPK